MHKMSRTMAEGQRVLPQELEDSGWLPLVVQSVLERVPVRTTCCGAPVFDRPFQCVHEYVTFSMEAKHMTQRTAP